MIHKLDVHRMGLGGISLLVTALAGCLGQLGGAPEEGGEKGGKGIDTEEAPVRSAVYSGARRLTRTEYDSALEELLLDDTHSGFAKLPEDVTDPFDNDYTTQETSSTLVSAVETLAEEAAKRAMENPATFAAVVPCVPSGPDDGACLRELIRSFGRRALRRPLDDEEVEGYAALGAYSVETGKFETGAELVIRALLQSPEFVYRIEVGTPVPGEPGVFALDDYEMATRLSFFLLGTTPPEALLDMADQHLLTTQAGVKAAAEMLLEDPRAKARVSRFHALWLGYAQLPNSDELNTAMQAESDALVSRIVFDEKRDYLDIFRSDETFVNDLLAENYGLPAPGSAEGAWVSYGETGRKGLLSQGSVLAAFGKFSDTSPTQRGIFIRTRLLCQDLPPPPPTVAADQPPSAAAGTCKIDRYTEHATNGSCAGCHKQMDPVGLGLENYDLRGRYRTHDDGHPECPIAGDGRLEGVGDFNGPAELEDLLISSGGLESCVVDQVYRFAMGRRWAAGDLPLLEQLRSSFKQGGHAFDRLLVDIATSYAFSVRREEE